MKLVHYMVHQADLKTWGSWTVCGATFKKKWATRKRSKVTCTKCIRLIEYNAPYRGPCWRLRDDGTWEKLRD